MATNFAYHQSGLVLQEELIIIEKAKLNPKFFAPIYEKYHNSIFRYVHKRVDEPEIANDITSCVFVKALSALNKYEFRGVPFSMWCTQNIGQDSNGTFSSCRPPSLHTRGTCHEASGSSSFLPVTWLIRWSRKWRWLRCSFCRKSLFILNRYVLLLFGPVYRQVLNAKPFPQIGNCFWHGVYHMGDFVADNELDILALKKWYLSGKLVSHEQPVLNFYRT